MKRYLSLILAIVTLLVLVLPAYAAEGDKEENYDPPELKNIASASVYCVEEDRFIYGLNEEKQVYPTSTVKLMVAILAVEAFGEDLEREITVPVEAILTVQGNNIGLKRDEVLTARELLYALICGGANDVANVLAYEISGSVEEFVKKMNEKAAEIGAVNTKYLNVSGMHHPAMVTTAKDTAIIAAYAAHSEFICDVSSQEKIVLEATNKSKSRTIYNKNCYFATNMEYKYIWSVPRGLNAGFTAEGGYCVATTASKDGLTYVVTVMGAKADDDYIYSYTEAAKLIKWALKAYGYKTVLSTSDMICEVPVKLASRVDSVALFPSQLIELYLPVDVDVEKDVKITWELTKDSFTAPISDGEEGGTLTVSFEDPDRGDRFVGHYKLVTRNSVDRNNFLYILDLIGMLFETKAFRVAVVIAVIGAIGYIGAAAWLWRRRQKLLPKRKADTRKRPGIASGANQPSGSAKSAQSQSRSQPSETRTNGNRTGNPSARQSGSAGYKR